MGESAVKCDQDSKNFKQCEEVRFTHYNLDISDMFFHIQVSSEYFEFKFIQCPGLSLDRHYSLVVM